MPLPVLNPVVAAWEPCGYARHAELVPGSRQSREDRLRLAQEARERGVKPPPVLRGKHEWVCVHCDGELEAFDRVARIWFWDSVYGKHLCGYCHPPAHDSLVLDEFRAEAPLWILPETPETPPGIPLENKDLEGRS